MQTKEIHKQDILMQKKNKKLLNLAEQLKNVQLRIASEEKVNRRGQMNKFYYMEEKKLRLEKCQRQGIRKQKTWRGIQ